jgi:hypothetical protein
VAYNKIAEIGKFIKNQNLFIIIPEAGKSKSKGLADPVSSEGLFSAFKMVPCCCTLQRGPMLCPYMAEGRARKGKMGNPFSLSFFFSKNLWFYFYFYVFTYIISRTL